MRPGIIPSRIGRQLPSKIVAAAGAKGGTVDLYLTDAGNVTGISTTLAVIANMHPVSKVARGYKHYLILKDDGTVHGALTSGTSLGAEVPPIGLSNVIDISAGEDFSLALKNDGKVVVWGDSNKFDPIPEDLSGVIAVSAGFNYWLALKSDGTVSCFNKGSNLVAFYFPVAGGLKNQQGAIWDEGLSNVIAISAGHSHAVALINDGTVVSWGSSTYGENVTPAGLSGVVAVSAGRHHTCALKNDGTVVVWGYQPGTFPVGLSDVVAISAGHYRTIAVKSDGTFAIWGLDIPASPTIIPAVADRSLDAVRLVELNTNRPIESVSVQGLPAGLSYEQSTGLVTGTPTVTGEFPISVTASGPGGETTGTITLVVAGTPIP
jgi:alpha-tubulin suppressor-like RCC1 family protein